MSYRTSGIAAIISAGVAVSGAWASSHGEGDEPRTSTLFADLITLNERQGSTVSGRADVTVREWSDRAEIRWQIQASGFEPGRAHLQHVHGRFESDPMPANDPSAINGPFFSGEGGTPFVSFRPEFPQNDFNNDGYITFIEGVPAYGPVVQSLTLAQPPHPMDGVSDIETIDMVLADVAGMGGMGGMHGGGGLTADEVELLARDFFPTADPDGTIDYDVTFTYDLTDADARRQFNNLNPLDGNRVIVLHGMTIDVDSLDLRDFELANVTSDGFDIVSPVATGVIVPTPAAAGPGLLLLSGLMARRRRAAKAAVAA